MKSALSILCSTWPSWPQSHIYTYRKKTCHLLIHKNDPFDLLKAACFLSLISSSVPLTYLHIWPKRDLCRPWTRTRTASKVQGPAIGLLSEQHMGVSVWLRPRPLPLPPKGCFALPRPRDWTCVYALSAEQCVYLWGQQVAAGGAGWGGPDPRKQGVRGLSSFPVWSLMAVACAAKGNEHKHTQYHLWFCLGLAKYEEWLPEGPVLAGRKRGKAGSAVRTLMRKGSKKLKHQMNFFYKKNVSFFISCLTINHI